MTDIKNISQMTLVTVHINESIETALLIMKTHHFRHLPVVNDQKDIVGLISDRDLLFHFNEKDKKVLDIMKKHLISVDIKSEIKDVVEKIIENKISAILITQNEKICGIVTTEDMMRLLLKYLRQNTLAPTFLESYVDMFKDYFVTIKNPTYV